LNAANPHSGSVTELPDRGVEVADPWQAVRSRTVCKGGNVCNALASVLVSHGQEGAPMQKVQTTPVRFKVARAIELEPGLVLRSGVYIGTKTRTRVDSINGVSWTPSKYKPEFTADQLTSMGAQVKPNLIAKNIDVTKFVRLGKLRVA
jgi:hypothetical protein